MRDTWRGILGEARFQKPLCRLLLRSRFLRKQFKQGPTNAERQASWNRPEDYFVRLESQFLDGQNTYDLFEEMVPVEGRWVLDLACGQAALSCQYVQAGAHIVVGCDRNYEGWPLRNARAYVQHKGLQERVPLVQGDALILPFKNDTFDLIVLNDAGDHIVGLLQAIKECYRVLVPGGHVVISFIPWYHPAGFHLMNYIYIPYAHLVFSERAIMKVLLERAAKDPAITKSIPGLKRNPPPASFDEMNIVLSRITIRKFKNLLRYTNFRVNHFKLVGFGRKMKKRALAAILDALTRVPLVNEFFTSRINCVLEKPANG